MRLNTKLLIAAAPGESLVYAVGSWLGIRDPCLTLQVNLPNGL